MNFKDLYEFVNGWYRKIPPVYSSNFTTFIANNLKLAQIISGISDASSLDIFSKKGSTTPYMQHTVTPKGVKYMINIPPLAFHPNFYLEYCRNFEPAINGQDMREIMVCALNHFIIHESLHIKHVDKTQYGVPLNPKQLLEMCVISRSAFGQNGSKIELRKPIVIIKNKTKEFQSCTFEKEFAITPELYASAKEYAYILFNLIDDIRIESIFRHERGYSVNFVDFSEEFQHPNWRFSDPFFPGNNTVQSDPFLTTLMFLRNPINEIPTDWKEHNKADITNIWEIVEDLRKGKEYLEIELMYEACSLALQLAQTGELKSLDTKCGFSDSRTKEERDKGEEPSGAKSSFDKNVPYANIEYPENDFDPEFASKAKSAHSDKIEKEAQKLAEAILEEWHEIKTGKKEEGG